MQSAIFVVILVLHLVCINTQNPGSLLKKHGRICKVNICKNGGLCVLVEQMDVKKETCICSFEYSGTLCEINNKVAYLFDDICLSMPCMNSGTCISQGSKYFCKCPNGFTGINCEKTIKCIDLCLHAVNCYDYVGEYHCECKPGWSGQRCDQDFNKTLGNVCGLNTCINGGTCTSLIGKTDHICDCPPGFIGQSCEIDIDECISNPCLNGGTCHDLINGFKCNCNNNYTGILCQTPLGACAKNPNSCLSNDTCLEPTSSLNDYYCICPQDKNCKVNTNDCSTTKCPTVKVCVDGITTYKCQCPEEYTEDFCSKLTNYCQKSPCKNNSTCVDNHDGFTCLCAFGFEGTLCDQDINECEVSKDICHNGLCINKNGTYQCYCQPGYSGDNCDLNLNECLSLPCLNGATCEDKINGYNCICPDGYSGKQCHINVDKCILNPCLNGATCIREMESFICSCRYGFGGKLCDININDCTSSSCKNMGLCIDGIQSYECDCTDTGFEGNHCEININDCLYNPCKNNGTCIDETKGYSCSCSIGYAGKNCDIYLNECASNPCQYGSICVERYDPVFNYHSNKINVSMQFQQELNYTLRTDNNKFECICSPGTTGVKCETILTNPDSSTGYLILKIFIIIGLGSLIAYIVLINRTRIGRYKQNCFGYLQPDIEMVSFPSAEPEQFI